MKNNLLRHVPVVVWMCLIYLMSSRTDLSTGQVEAVDFIFKKTAHFVEYFILNLLWFRAIGIASPAQSTLYSLIFAFTDEIHQLFIPGRTGKLRDVGIDFVGISASSLLLIKFPSWKNFLFQAPSKKHKK